jgi:hypothetical protein
VSATAEALRKLREYLNEHPDEASAVIDHSANLQNGRSILMQRFVNGHYKGLPERFPEDSPERKSWFWMTLRVIAQSVVIGTAAMLAGYLASKRWA